VGVDGENKSSSGKDGGILSSSDRAMMHSIMVQPKKENGSIAEFEGEWHSMSGDG
jgi:hypothetical protein